MSFISAFFKRFSSDSKSKPENVRSSSRGKVGGSIHSKRDLTSKNWSLKLSGRSIDSYVPTPTLEKNTKFTKDELKQWYKGFIKDCPNGRLSRADFIEIYKDIVPTGDPVGFATRLFDMFDTDGSEELDFEEFVTAMSITSTGKIEEKLEWAFKLYDDDGNGSISKSEMIKMIKATDAMNDVAITSSPSSTSKSDVNNNSEQAKTAEERTDIIFEKLDEDKNGSLDLQEFIKGCTEMEEGKSLITVLNVFDGMAT